LDDPDEEPAPTAKAPPPEIFYETSSDNSSLVGTEFLVPPRHVATPTLPMKAAGPQIAIGAGSVARARKIPSVTRSDSGTMSTTLSIKKKAGKRKGEFSFIDPDDAERMALMRVKKLEAASLENDQLALETQSKALRAKSEAMDFRMKNIERLETMRTKFPQLTRKEILDWMPDLKDAADLVWKEETVGGGESSDNIEEFTD
jgi:hypothetical protein